MRSLDNEPGACLPMEMLHIAAKVIYSFGVHYGHLGFLRGGNPRRKRSADLGERFIACNFRDTVKGRGDASDF